MTAIQLRFPGGTAVGATLGMTSLAASTMSMTPMKREVKFEEGEVHKSWNAIRHPRVSEASSHVTSMPPDASAATNALLTSNGSAVSDASLALKENGFTASNGLTLSKATVTCSYTVATNSLEAAPVTVAATNCLVSSSVSTLLACTVGTNMHGMRPPVAPRVKPLKKQVNVDFSNTAMPDYNKCKTVDSRVNDPEGMETRLTENQAVVESDKNCFSDKHDHHLQEPPALKDSCGKFATGRGNSSETPSPENFQTSRENIKKQVSACEQKLEARYKEVLQLVEGQYLLLREQLEKFKEKQLTESKDYEESIQGQKQNSAVQKSGNLENNLQQKRQQHKNPNSQQKDSGVVISKTTRGIASGKRVEEQWRSMETPPPLPSRPIAIPLVQDQACTSGYSSSNDSVSSCARLINNSSESCNNNVIRERSDSINSYSSSSSIGSGNGHMLGQERRGCKVKQEVSFQASILSNKIVGPGRTSLIGRLTFGDDQYAKERRDDDRISTLTSSSSASSAVINRSASNGSSDSLTLANRSGRSCCSRCGNPVNLYPRGLKSGGTLTREEKTVVEKDSQTEESLGLNFGVWEATWGWGGGGSDGARRVCGEQEGIYETMKGAVGSRKIERYLSNGRQARPLLVRVLHAFQKKDATELNIKPGDIIQVLTKEPSGWWTGTIDGQTGYFPSTYVELIPEEEPIYDIVPSPIKTTLVYNEFGYPEVVPKNPNGATLPASSNTITSTDASHSEPLDRCQGDLTMRLLATLRADGSEVCGVAQLHHRIYITCRESTSIIIYDAYSFSRVGELTVPSGNHSSIPGSDLPSPTRKSRVKSDLGDIAACDVLHCLYVYDAGRRCVWRMIDAGPAGQAATAELWLKLDDEYASCEGETLRYIERTLSVTSDGHVIMAVDTDPPRLDVYHADGRRLKAVVLPASIKRPRHAVESPTAGGGFIVSHGAWNSSSHCVCEVAQDGRIGKSYGGPRGAGDGRLDTPVHLATDAQTQDIYVADFNNRRVVILDSMFCKKAELWMSDSSAAGQDDEDGGGKPGRLYHVTSSTGRRRLLVSRTGIGCVDVYDMPKIART